jgi:hypothetical protein
MSLPPFKVKASKQELCPLALLSEALESKGSKAEGKESVLITSIPLTVEQKLAVAPIASVFSNSNSVYSIRLSKSSTLSTSGAGAMALATSVIPSTFAQYTQLSLLFNECRIKAVRMQVMAIPNPNAASSGTTSERGVIVCSAFNPRGGAGGSPTTSTTEVIRIPGAKLYNPMQMVRPVIIDYKFPRNMPWSTVSASSSGGTDPTGGISGYFCNVCLTTATVSSDLLQTLIEAEYEFRKLT